MKNQSKNKQIEELNEIFLNPNLRVEELEGRLELTAPWIYVAVCDEVCPPVVCGNFIPSGS